MSKDEKKKTNKSSVEYHKFMNMGADDFVKLAWHEFANNFGPILFAFIVQIIFSAIIVFFTQEMLVTAFANFPEGDIIMPPTLDLVIFIVIYFIGSVMILSGTLHVYNLIIKEESAGIGDFFKGLIKYPFRLLIQGVLLSLFVYLLAVPIVFLSAYGNFLMFVGMILAIVIFMFLFPFYLMAQPILVYENCGVFKSFSLAVNFAKEHYMVIFSAAFIQIFGSLMIQMIFGFLSWVFIPYIWYTIGASLAIILNLFMMLVYFKVYDEFKDIKWVDAYIPQRAFDADPDMMEEELIREEAKMSGADVTVEPTMPADDDVMADSEKDQIMDNEE